VSARNRPPARRPSVTTKTTWRGITVFVTAGIHPQTGEIVEIFADVPTRSGSDLSMAVSDAACVPSVALQMSATLAEFNHSLMSVPTYSGGEEPASVVGLLVSTAMAVEHGLPAA